MRYVVDSSIWIKLLRKENRVRAHFERVICGEDELIVTPVAYFEVMRGLVKREDEKSLSFISELWKGLRYEETNQRVWDEAIRLYVLAIRQNQRREDADTILAAFASVLGATIVTTNQRHFEVFGLRVANWAA